MSALGRALHTTAAGQPSALQLVMADQVPPQPWRNGGGATRELLVWPPAMAGQAADPAADTWQLRISLADITRDGPFSAFAGVQRWFTVVQGAGVHLRWPGQPARSLTPDSPPLHFDGGDAPGCDLIHGTTRDLNLMLRGPAALRGRMQVAQAGLPWVPQAGGLRALFSREASRLQIGNGAPLLLPPLCLAFDTDANANHEAWCWQPEQPTQATPQPARAWWLTAPR